MAEEEPTIFALRTTANREDQVMDFVSSNAQKKKLAVFSIIRPHGMRGYIFLEADSNTLYDQLIEDLDAGVVGQQLQSRKTRTICFPQYDVKLDIRLDLSCDLPSDDMALFEVMGKVETEYHQATVSKTVFCDIGELPF